MNISFATYRLLILIWIGIAVAVFILLLRINAPYGRHASSKWGPLVDNHIAWLVMEFPALAVMLFCFMQVISHSMIMGLMAGLFCFHYVNRVFIFPFRIHTKGKKMPLVIMLSAVFFNLVNTYFLGYYFLHFASYPDDYIKTPMFIAGCLLFIAGLIINWTADNRLIHLRKRGETGYKIPQGWLFSYISCPNLFGELIEWGGFALLCSNLPALTFFIWTVANLLPRALAHHRWYKENFADYPTERRAVIPFVL